MGNGLRGLAHMFRIKAIVAELRCRRVLCHGGSVAAPSECRRVNDAEQAVGVCYYIIDAITSLILLRARPVSGGVCSPWYRETTSALDPARVTCAVGYTGNGGTHERLRGGSPKGARSCLPSAVLTRPWSRPTASLPWVSGSDIFPYGAGRQ